MIDPPAAGAWNMAVDEALLATAGRAGQGGSLRFYLWDQPTVSLGYFQRYADRDSHPASRDCPLVRRSTGGGAIVHAIELTYSYAVGIEQGGERDWRSYYAAFHETLIEELATCGVEAWQWAAAPERDDLREEAFLCFQRRAACDVMIAGAKIAGSAQRRKRHALLQHGSVLLGTSPAAPELPGIRELAGVEVPATQLAHRWAQRLSCRLGVSLRPAVLAPDEVELGKRLLAEKFSDPQWTHRR